MTAAPQWTHEPQPGLMAGRVLLRQGEHYAVALEQPNSERGGGLRGRVAGERRARRAASCLLVPEPGDRVLLALEPEPFIVAVLERGGEQPAALRLDGDVRLEVPSGKLDIAASEGVRLRSDRAISLLSRALRIESGSGELLFGRLEAVASATRAHIGKLSLVADTCDVVAERIAQRAKRAYRFVEELDQLRARYLDHRADDLLQLKGKNTVLTAREVTKIDGEQIHVG